MSCPEPPNLADATAKLRSLQKTLPSNQILPIQKLDDSENDDKQDKIHEPSTDEIIESINVKVKARTDTYIKMWRAIHENRILFNTHPDEYNTTKEMQEMFEEFRTLKGISKKKADNHHPMFWITVNPQNDELNMLMKRTLKMCSKVWIDKYYYVYEQRAKYPDPWKGYHVHALVIKKPDDNRRSDREYANELRNSVRTLCGNEHAVKITPCHIDQKDKIIKYMLGTKDDPEKIHSVEHNKTWRAHNGLLPIYTNDPDYKAIQDTLPQCPSSAQVPDLESKYDS